jgi:predicted nucleotide-binding protein
MSGVSERPTVFVGSSTGALTIARVVCDILSKDADALIWSVAFDPGTWTLQVILDHSQKSDFGLFIMAPDDRTVIREKEQYTVRDNVLFEIGVFMGALGPRRTFILWPAKYSGELRLPSDLLGLTTVEYEIDIPTDQKRYASSLSKLKTQLSILSTAIKDLGPALRSSYNEIAWIDQLEQQREQVFRDDTSESFKDIIAPIAARRKKPWYQKTPVELLLTGIAQKYDDTVVDNIFWWLMVDGVLTFDNIDIWTSEDDFHWSTSVEYTIFTDRGVAWLNQLRSERSRS